MLGILEFWDLCTIAGIVMLFAGGAAGASTVARKRGRRDTARLERLEKTVERLEKKLELMLQKAGIEYAHLDPPRLDLPAEIVAALRQGMISRAAELYEKTSGKSHQEALKLIEGVYERKEF